MWKQYRKRIGKVAAFLAAVGIMLHFFNWFFLWNNVTTTLCIDGFYMEPKDSLDVVLIGASELYTSFNSPLAWEEFGFTSYSLATAGFPGNLYQSALAETLRTQSPKLVIFEINGFLYPDAEMQEEGKLRKWIDNLPFSENKLDVIQKNVPEESRYSYYFPLYKYHTNWERIKKCVNNATAQLMLKENGTMRTKSFYVVAKMDPSTTLTERNPVLGDIGRQSLYDVLEYCREQGLSQVLFVRCPHKEELGKEGREAFCEMQAMIEAYGYDFVNFENSYDEIGLDLAKDFYNAGHMNIFGMQKYTKFFSTYLSEHYDIVSEHQEETEKTWDVCAEYMHRVISYAEKQTLKNTGKAIQEFTKIE